MGSGPTLSACVEALPQLWFFALRLTSTSAAAESLVKDSYLTLGGKRYKPATHVSPRVAMMATMLTLWKKSQMTAGSVRNTAAHVESDCDESRRLLQIVDTLPDDERVAIILVEAEHLSRDDAAWALGIPPAALEQRLERAHIAVSIAFENTARAGATRFAQLSKSERVRA
jgi:RNA polymerase sigma-70 factor (ECF subfamily)